MQVIHINFVLELSVSDPLIKSPAGRISDPVPCTSCLYNIFQKKFVRNTFVLSRPSKCELFYAVFPTKILCVRPVSSVRLHVQSIVISLFSLPQPC